MITAAEAEKIGLVNQVFSPADLMSGVIKTAEMMAEKGKVSLRAAKQVINSGMDTDLSTGCKMEIDAFALCVASEDAKEGTAAFLEKRKAAFKGSLS